MPGHADAAGPRPGAHTVAVLALEDVIAFDVATPVEVFGRAVGLDGGRAYEVVVCGPAGRVQAGPLGIDVPSGLEALACADTVVVPGRYDPLAASPTAVLAALRAAAQRGARLASICVGAFTLAEAGLLDGRTATTHWAAAAELARRHPAVTVDPAVLYVDHGALLTSAGAAAGLDMCLHMVRTDLGAAAAAAVARATVMPLERSGGQAQFIPHPAPALRSEDSLAPLLEWLHHHLDQPLPTSVLARQAGLSERSLHRRFREQTGVTPTRWLQVARVRRAQQLLETSDLGVERVAGQAGLGSPAAFREAFRRVAGTSPQAYRRAFRGSGDRDRAAGRPGRPVVDGVGWSAREADQPTP